MLLPGKLRNGRHPELTDSLGEVECRAQPASLHDTDLWFFVTPNMK
jgi:hypothetical protein